MRTPPTHAHPPAASHLPLTAPRRSAAALARALPPDASDVLCLLCLVMGGLRALERDDCVPAPCKAAALRSFHLTVFKR
jgi:hypothetical protein